MNLLAEPRRLLVVLSCLLLTTRVYGGTGDKNTSISTTGCSCEPRCADSAKDTAQLTKGGGYYFDVTLGRCGPVPNGCGLADECRFATLAVCESKCRSQHDNSGSGCEATVNGCCPDKISVRKDDGSCDGGQIDSVEQKSSDNDVIAPHGSPTRGGVHWDMVGVGVGVMVVLLLVLVLSGVATYSYRHAHKDRQRSRYIHQVLQMYEEESDSSLSSDCSVDDNPETNNLFERL